VALEQLDACALFFAALPESDGMSYAVNV